MVTIRKYTAQQGLNPPSALNTRIADPTGDALQRLGGEISNVGEYFQQRDEKKQDFKAENDYRRLNLQLGQQMEDQAANMPEDGTGFHDSFINQVYKPARDQFIGQLPERLRDKYQVILGDETPDGGGADTKAWSVKAATRERDQLWNWYDGQLKIGQDELQTAISIDPDSYDTLREQGLREIDASGLPETKKAEQRRAWTRMAQVSHLNKMLETRPEQVLRDLGADVSHMSPTTQFSLLSNAVQQAETGGEANPDAAVSRTGAVGRMQVQPNTARDISKWMGDGLIDKNMSDARIAEIISNPVVNQKYGDFYLKRMIRDYSNKGGLEAALIAYNGGPARAEEWIKSGFDDSVLPKETRNYYKRIMKDLPSTYGKSGGAPKGDPSAVRFTGTDGSDQDFKNVSTDLTNRVQSAFANLGIDRVKVTSAFRDADTNARVGGAKGSQHVHGNAMDIDVSGYSIAERVNIIKSLSAAGITGLGIGTNIIHADIGGRRAWGYVRSDGGGPVPKWAQEAITEHLENRAQGPSRPVGVAGRYSGLPYADRQKYIAAADQAVTQQVTQANKATALQKTELRTAMSNELASLQTTGQTTNLVDDTAVSTILGEDDYLKWTENRDVARKTFAARDGIGSMSLDEMDTRLQDYRPDPGSPTFASDQKVEAAVQKEIDRVTRLRATKPTEAALMYPDVKQASDNIADAENPAPEAVQEFVRLNLEKQKEFGLKPGSEQPIPRPWAVQIGQSLSRIPEIKGRNTADVNAAILVMYDNLQKVFGEYTDEVVIDALREYKGVGPNTAALLNGYMQGIQAGGDPLARVRQQQNKALDQDQVESTTGKGFWGTTWDFITGRDNETDAPPAGPVDVPADEGVNDEQVLRAMTTIENLGEDMTPEQEQSLVTRYGKKTIDAARARIGSQN